MTAVPAITVRSSTCWRRLGVRDQRSSPVARHRCCRPWSKGPGVWRSPCDQSRFPSKARWDAASAPALAALSLALGVATCSPASMGPAWPLIESIGIASRIPSMAELLDLSVDLGRGLRLRSPVMVASGTFGYGFDAPLVDRTALGAIVTKGTTRAARTGNPPVRIAETASGMLNAIGLQNPGVDHVAQTYAPQWVEWDLPVIVNIAGESIEGHVEVARRLDGRPGVAGIELNISCPNVEAGLQVRVDAWLAAQVTEAVRAATEMPL